ncbi:hypothetical protein LOZ58_005931 [Ophidiomyces ophidiicola]|nr:hypothetical protein LOZ66_006112 [Ophidiomyces ophidiicola]KAI1957009.1 hypothetical protein LOZ58_005931 [Ophidiomyces ophidiicola]
MAVDKINVWSDPRIQKCSTFLNGTRYGYLLGVPPNGDYRATIFLIHGFPDLSMGWRYQIPTLLNMGLRVVVPDCLGYGRTEAPEFSEESAPRYAFKQCAEDMKELARQLGTSQIILGGHDWGGFVVYRIALHCPGFVTHIFSVCTPYGPPHREYVPLDKLVATRIPFFGYQLQFVSGELEKKIKTKNDIRQFLIALFGGRTPEGEIGFDVTKGAFLDKVPNLRPSRLLSEEELDYYVEEYSRTGIHGPLNWYRTREQNYKEDLELIGQKWEVPVLFIRATKDDALRPELSKNMGKYIPNLTQAEVDATHWALWQKPEECNAIISSWIENVAFGGRSKM